MLSLLIPLLVPIRHTVRVTDFAGLAAACRNAKPGDLILVAKGTYTVSGASRISIVDRPGPVTVRGETGDPADVVVRGKGQDDEAVQMVFDLTDSPRWTFENLTTRDSYFHGFKFNAGSTDCVLRNVVMRDHGESGVKGTSDPAKGRYPDRLLVDHCDIGFDTDGGGTRDVVEGIDGVGVKGWTVRGSRFVNVRHRGSVAYAVFTKGNSSDTVIEGNRFENCDVGASFGGGGTGAPYFRDLDRTFEHRRGIIRNNLFLRCRDAGVYINRGTQAKVYNNTLFECVLSIQLRFADSSGWVRNNLVKPSPENPGEPPVRVRDGATLLGGEANLPASDADFRGVSDRLDLRLSGGSRAVDSGIDLGTDVSVDFDGRRRPVRRGFDVGAFESAKAPMR